MVQKKGRIRVLVLVQFEHHILMNGFKNGCHMPGVNQCMNVRANELQLQQEVVMVL